MIAAEYGPVSQGLLAWAGKSQPRAYWDGRNYRLFAHRSPIAPWNKEVKRAIGEPGKLSMLARLLVDDHD